MDNFNDLAISVEAAKNSCRKNGQEIYPSHIIIPKSVADMVILDCIRSNAYFRFNRLIRWLIYPILNRYWRFEDIEFKELKKCENPEYHKHEEKG